MVFEGCRHGPLRAPPALQVVRRWSRLCKQACSTESALDFDDGWFWMMELPYPAWMIRVEDSYSVTVHSLD